MTVDVEDQFRHNCLNDTGFLGRNVLGYNYDQDHETQEHVNVGKGGIRNEGPHKEMGEFIDGPGRLKMLQAPRDSLKTTFLKAFCVRRALANPNIRILYGMAESSEAENKVKAIKEHFEREPKLIEHFGILVDEERTMVGTPWQVKGFTLATRTIVGLDNPTFSCFGVDKNKVGGHFDLIILDDLVTDKRVKNPEQIQKVIDTWKFCQPLLDPGGQIIVCGTRYADDDLYGWIEANLSKRFKTLIIDCGMYPEKDPDTGAMMLVGEPRFAHLTKGYLEEKLATMGVDAFSSQYCNNPLGVGRQFFSARDFRPAVWEDWMGAMPCYVFTDTAVGQKEENCHSVVAIGGLDEGDRFYLMDVAVGHWAPNEFVTQLHDLVVRWQSKVEIRGILMEGIALNKVFASMMEHEGRRRRIRPPRIFEVPRSAAFQSKRQRIQSMTGRIADGRMLILSSVPKYYRDLGKALVLWDPEGAKDDKGYPYPDGELVRQFTRFPAYGKNDIADALADVDSRDRIGARLCYPMSPIRAERRRGMGRKRRGRRPGELVTMRQRINGIDVSVPARADYDSPDRGWSDLAKRTSR